MRLIKKIASIIAGLIIILAIGGISLFVILI